MNRFFILMVCLLISAGSQSQVKIWDVFEKEIVLSAVEDPFSKQLTVEVERPDKSRFTINGFFAGEARWKFRIMPDQTGKWRYTARFSDNSAKAITGSFQCRPSDIPGLISANESNPVWFGYKGGKHVLIRSFHVGDRFFAENWPDSERNQFLDWLTENKYNTISVASHLLNRNDEKRGKGWNTPYLWDSEKQEPNPAAYDKMERILNELAARRIMVFPFAGFFGQKSNHPREKDKQDLYIRYTIARLGAYWNIMYNVAGPEPLYDRVNQFTKEQVNELGRTIQKYNTQGHLLTVHNPKDLNPFVNAPWLSFQCLQGPTTINTDTLYMGIMARRNPKQPVLAQEVLWYGNIYQPKYTDEQVRKNAFTILMAGAALNFGDNAGTSSTGFTGTLNLSERHQEQHEIIKKVWDFFESFPFYELIPGQNICDNGYALKKEGEKYLVYLPQGGRTNVFTSPGKYHTTWIKGSDTQIRVSAGITDGRMLTAPSDSDWLLLLEKAGSASASPHTVLAGFGSYPDIAADSTGMLHMVYAREGRLYYRTYNPVNQLLGNEQYTTLNYQLDKYLGPGRSDPEVMVDSKWRVHVFVGQEYACWNGMAWVKTKPGVTRDTDMGITPNGDVFITKRGGNNGGLIGIMMKTEGSSEFIATAVDPDIGTEKGKEWIGKGDHVYGSIALDRSGGIHLVYRQAKPEYVSYRRSNDYGKTWRGCGVYGGDAWQGEAADIAVTSSGEVLVISHQGELFSLNEKSFSFVSRGKLIDCHERDLPSLSTGNQKAVCITSFGGKYYFLQDNKPESGKIQSVTGKPIGFTESVFAGNRIWAVYEEGDEVSNNELAGTSAIFLRLLK